MPKVERWQLLQRQGQALDAKIQMSLARIRAWHEAWDGVYVAFSGGLDSTVLLHLVRSLYPDCPAVFCNTGLEFPEIVKFVRSTLNVTWLRPKMRFQEVVRKYGYPVISKRVAHYIHEVQHSWGETATKRLRLTGIRSDGTFSKMGMIPYKWQYLCQAPFGVSEHCCHYMKKLPAREADERFGPPMLGMRVDEGNQRLEMYYRHGCNALDLKRPRSWPLAFWSDEDVREYIEGEGLAYSPLYDMGYKRSGCFACMFGVHLEAEPNRFQRLLHTHPKLYDYCMDRLGLARVLDYIHVPYREPQQLRLFE